MAIKIDKEIVLPQGKTTTLKGVAGSDFLYPVAKDKKRGLKIAINVPTKIDGDDFHGDEWQSHLNRADLLLQNR